MFDEHVADNPDYIAQLSRDGASKFKPVTYLELQRKIRSLASSLKKIGIKRGEIVAIISDNRAEWLVVDMAILSLGAIDTPRGRDAMDYEIEYILRETGAEVAFVENYDMAKRVAALKPSLSSWKPHLRGVRYYLALYSLFDYRKGDVLIRIRDRIIGLRILRKSHPVSCEELQG